MKGSTQRYLIVLHEIQHVLLSEEAGVITAEQAEADVADLARRVPALDREWRAEIGQ